MANKISKFIAKRGFEVVPDETYFHVEEWLEWYQNDVRKFHKYKIYNGVTTTTQERMKLGMAKTVCEDWANLLLNEKVAIQAGTFDKALHEVLKRNNFRVQANQLVEKVFALGTGAMVEYLDAEGDVVIDYYAADMIYPLSWDNGIITECAFGTVKVFGGKDIIYLQMHRKGNADNAEENTNEYYIQNIYLDAESGKEIAAPEDIETYVATGSEIPLFQIIKPNICNNIDIDSPLGISAYANAIPQLKGCDITYDSFMNEFELGRKRILVPVSAAKVQMQKDGVALPSFDPNDSVYYMMPGDRESDMRLTEIDMKIRAAEHEAGINKCLDLLSMKAGMGTGRYKFENGQLKTATEVISDKSELYENKKKHEIILEEAIVAMVEAIAFLSGQEAVEVTINFDDSIIEDTNTMIDRNIKLVSAGLRSKITAIMEINHCTEAEAQKELEKINNELQITSGIDWSGTEDEEESEENEDVEE